MKNVKTAIVVVLTIVAVLLLASNAKAGQNYNCKSYGILGSTCEYTGTTTQQDVVDYISDAKEAALGALEFGGSKVYYKPSTGVVVVEVTKETWKVDRVAIGKLFKSKNLYVSQVVVLDSYGNPRFAHEPTLNPYHTKGYKRWAALRAAHESIERSLLD